ncbi:MAG TPA: carboxypeptidase-like regulatory domain-containing protein [Solirubrobacterales bacterium]|nr:carboxypeptidase-like regulatory domain-containing protein [Solirubrobacterales bacterium]
MILCRACLPSATSAAVPCTHRNFGLFLEIVRLTEPSGERMAMTRQGRVSGLAVALCAMAALLSAQSAAAATAEIHGKVTDHLGDPIAGITVCAHGLTMFVGSECDWQTDSQGEYSIAGLQPASYRVGFHNEGNTSLNYVPQWYSGKAHPEEADPVELGSGESREINAQLQTGGQFKGTIADLHTDLPIEGVEVCANSVDFRQDEEFGYCGRSNAAGEFAVKNLGTGHYRLEFRTEGHVNYVEEQLPQAPGSIALTAGGEIEIEAHLVPGIEIDGTVTEAGTGTPIAPFESSVCALDSATEARVKCAPVESAGQYAIPGLPPGTYAVAFSLDWVEEGLDLHPDGYVRRYWNEVPSFGEATLLSGSPGAVLDEIDAALSKGEEVFPSCEVPSACPSSDPGGSPSTGGGLATTTTTTTQPDPPKRQSRCKNGKKLRHGKCVKVKKKHPRKRK